MGDSFFTARNIFDRQIDNPTMDGVSSTMLIEAAARRIARYEGPLEAAKQLQRVADICAGAHVLPIDHWQKLGKPTSAPETPPPAPREPSKWARVRTAVIGNLSVEFWSGFVLGLFWESLWR